MGRKLAVLWDERELGNSVMLFYLLLLSLLSFSMCPTDSMPNLGILLKNNSSFFLQSELYHILTGSVSLSAKLVKIWGVRRRSRCPAGERQSHELSPREEGWAILNPSRTCIVDGFRHTQKGLESLPIAARDWHESLESLSM